MNEQNNRVLEIINDTNQDVQNTITATCTGQVSLSGEFNSNQVEWTTLGPQNTYITFHTLPFNLDQIQGASEIAAGECGDLSVITADGSVVSGQEQFVIPDNSNVKHDVAFTEPVQTQFIMQAGPSGKQEAFPATVQPRFIMRSSSDVKNSAYSDSDQSQVQSQIILQSSDHDSTYTESTQPQFIIQSTTQREHNRSYNEGNNSQFIVQNSTQGIADTSYTEGNQSRFIIQNSTPDDPNATYNESDQGQFILQNGGQDDNDTQYTESDQSEFILQTATCSDNQSYTNTDQSQFIMQSTAQHDQDTTYTELDQSQHNQDTTYTELDQSQHDQDTTYTELDQSQHDQDTTYTELDQSQYVLQRDPQGKDDTSYSEPVPSNLESPFVLESSANDKSDTFTRESRFSSESKSQTAVDSDYSQDLSSQLDKLSIFTDISVSVSSALLDVIPGCQSMLLEEVEAEPGTQVHEADNGYTVAGNLEMIVHLYNRIQEMLNIPGSSRLKFVGEEVTKPEVHDRGTNCNILVPFVSSRGREIHQPTRYGGCLQLQELDDDDDVEDKPVLSRRGRKSQPKKLRGAVVSMKHEDNEAEDKTQQKNDISKPLDALIFAAAGAPMSQDVQQEYNYDASLEYTPKYIGSKRPEKMGKNYEALSPFKFFCPVCSFRTKRESHFIKHRKLHENNSTKLQHCSKCNFVSVRLSVLRRHEIIHSTHVFQCNICPYKADNLKLLRRHKLLRHESNQEKRHQLKFCPDCDYKTVHDTLYHRHLQTHASSRVLPVNGTASEYVCSECSYTTIRKEHYIRHRKNVHGNARPFLCDTCGMAFKRPDTLAQHKIVHVDRKDRSFAFNCTQCNKGFRSQAHLKEHETMHSKDRPFLCDHCGASFKTPQVQKKHIQTIHLNPRSFSCAECNKRFNTKYALHRHMRTHELPTDVQTTELPPVQDMEHADITGLTTDQLSEIDAEALQTIQTNQALDVVSAAMEETFDQSDETLHQAYIQPNETTTALLYLTGNLQNIEYNPS